MASSLESLLAEGVVSEIYGRIKTGKEAEVYAVRYGDRVVAAKVYKDRAQRSFKNNSTYKEGRAVRNTRSQRAMDRGSKFGQEAAEDAWKAEEANALYKLHAAGVRVPTPVMYLEGVLLMELVRGADGEAAPRLIDTDLGGEQARAAYHDMLSQLVRILTCDLIHGDLSPYNVLWGEAGATIIDFPQVVSAAQNSNSEAFFLRDAKNILGHFAAIEPSLRSRLHSDPREIWRAYVRRELTPDFLPSGRLPPERPHFHDAARRGADHGGQHRGPRPESGGQHRGPRADHGGQHRGPRPESGGQHRAPRVENGGQHRGPRPESGGQYRGPRPGSGSPEPRASDSRFERRASGSGDSNQRSGQRLQMAPARANAAAQTGRRPERRPPRAPEVIVLTRRASEATAPAANEPRARTAAARPDAPGQGVSPSRRRR